MKLHLPKSLRAAVLTCLAVTGGLSTTVATGVLAGGAMMIAFAPTQALAVAINEDTVLTDKADLPDEDLTVNAGCELTLSGGNVWSLALSKNVTVYGTLTLTGNDTINYNATDAQVFTVDGGTLNFGSTRQSLRTLCTFNLNNGSLIGAGDGNGILDFFQADGKITSTGTSTIEGPLRLRNGGQQTTLDVADGVLKATSTMGAGALRKTGSGTLQINGTFGHTGNSVLAEGLTEMVGNGSSLTNAVLEGGDLKVSGSATLTNVTITTGNLDVAGTASIGTGNLTAGKLTVGGKANFTTTKINGTEIAVNGTAAFGTTTFTTGTMEIKGDASFDSLNLGDGTITVTQIGTATISDLSVSTTGDVATLDISKYGALTLKKVNLTEAQTLNVNGDVTVKGGFLLTGGGTLNMDVLRVEGALNMNGHSGILNYNSIQLGEGTKLVYSEGDVMSLGAITDPIMLSVYGAADQLKSGINTGFFGNGATDLEALKELITVEGLSDFELRVKKGQVWLYSDAELTSDWDINWGMELSESPTTIAKGTIDDLSDSIDGITFYELYENEKFDDGSTISINLTGGAEDAVIVGGNDAHEDAHAGAVRRDVWIKATKGQYAAIVGGNYANNWSGGSLAHFYGDTHILVDGATVGAVIGANFKDGYANQNARIGAGFFGNTYITIASGEVNGTIVGAGTTAHDAITSMTGNTNIYIYKPLVTNAISIQSEPNNMIVGGFAWFAGNNRSTTINGDTNITVDLSDYKGSLSTFNKNIIGGSYSNRATWHTITGSTNITLDLGKVALATDVMVIGGNKTDNGSTSIDSTNINILSGKYNSWVVGGTWNTTNGGTHGINTTNINIEGGTFEGNILGGTRTEGSSTLNTGDTNITIGGKTKVNGTIYGSNFVEGTGASAIVAKAENVTITIKDDATVNNIIGGNYSVRAKVSNQNLLTDNVTINLEGGTVKGNIYAGGAQGGKGVVNTNNTRVVIGSGVKFQSGSIVSGGLLLENISKGGTVTGSATLCFTDNSPYDNIKGVEFIDFNTVEVAEGASIALSKFSTLGTTLNKAGLGTAEMSTGKALELENMTISGGSITLSNGISSPGLNLSMGADTRLITAGSLPIRKIELDMSSARYDSPETSFIAVDGALASPAGAVVNLSNLAGLSDGEYVLATMTSSNINMDGLFLNTDAPAQEGMAYELAIKDLEDGTQQLILRSYFTSEWVWNQPNGTWSNDTPDGWIATEDSPSGKDVFFSQESDGTLAIDGTVTPNSINIKGGDHTFTQLEGTTGGIQLQAGSTLQISRQASLNLALDNPNLGGKVDLMGKLTLSSENALGNSSLLLNGGTLAYADAITTDLSAQTSLADDYTGPVRISVDAADNTVTWAKPAAATANSGVSAILSNGLVKSGAGTFNLDWEYDTSIVSGAMSVEEGTLNLNATAKDGATIALNGQINVEEGTAFTFTTTALSVIDEPTLGEPPIEGEGEEGEEPLPAVTTIAGGTPIATISGQMTGTGTITIGSATTPGGYYLIDGANSDFAGTLVLLGNGEATAQNAVEFKSATAFGGEDTIVQMNGRGIAFAEDATAVATLEVIGSAEGNRIIGNQGQTYRFDGALIGDEESTLHGSDGEFTIHLAGDVSGYTGKIDSGVDNTWVLGTNEDDVADLNVSELTGEGLYLAQYGLASTISAPITGTASLQHGGLGTLTLTGASTSTGAMIIDPKCEVILGTATTAASWAGTELQGDGTLIVTNGTLSALTTKSERAQLVIRSAADKVVDVTGSDTSLINTIDLAANSMLIATGSDIVVGGETGTGLTLELGADNLGTAIDGSDREAMIDAASLTITGTENVNIGINNADLLTAIRDINVDQEAYLQLTSGTLSVGEGVNLNNLAVAPTLFGLGVRATMTEEGMAGGYITLSGKLTDVYFTDIHGENVSNNVLELYAGTVINKGDTLTIDIGKGISTTITNLNGQTDGKLLIKSGTVTLSNQVRATGVEGYDPMGADNVLLSDLTAETGTTLNVRGDLSEDGDQIGSLTVKGNLSADALNIELGSLVLAGAENTIDNLTSAAGSTLSLGKGSALVLTGSSNINGQVTGTATSGLTIQGSTALGSSGDIDGLALTITEKGSLNAGSADLALTALSSKGSIIGKDAIVTLKGETDSTVTGALYGTGSLSHGHGLGTLTVGPMSKSSGWNLINKGKMLIDLSDNSDISLNSLTLADNSTTTLRLGSSAIASPLSLGSLTIGTDTALTLQVTDSTLVDAGNYTVATITGSTTGSLSDLALTLSGEAFYRLDKENTYLFTDSNGNLVLHAERYDQNPLLPAATTENALAGAELLWNAKPTSHGDVESAYVAIADMVAAGNAEGAAEAMAAVAGSSIASMGMALSGDVERQLRSIRNRTTSMGVNEAVVNDSLPYFNAWVSAEGNSAELDKDGDMAGYTLDSWGGTVGFDADMSENLTIGMAITAMYGDLQADGPDTAEGDMDTTYVSLFARYAKSAWTHTFVATIGMMDGSLDRTVNVGRGYETKGETDGTSFGLMYEVGYVIALNDEATTCLQPIFNVMFRHTEVSGYTESGSDAALEVGDQTMDTITFGAGARLQAVVGQNIYNRASILEARALVKLDVGDTQSEADVAFVNGSSISSAVKSSELGAFGVELGVGIAIPMGDDDGSIFADASVELRSGYTNVNGTVGYRINF